MATVVAKKMDMTSSFFPKGRAYTGAPEHCRDLLFLLGCAGAVVDW